MREMRHKLEEVVGSRQKIPLKVLGKADPTLIPLSPSPGVKAMPQSSVFPWQILLPPSEHSGPHHCHPSALETFWPISTVLCALVKRKILIR